MKRISGRLIIVLGLIHTFVGLILFHSPTREIVSAGFINGVIQRPNPLDWIVEIGLEAAVKETSSRMSALWFFFAGFAWIILGSLCSWIENHLRRPLPGFLGPSLLFYGVLGTVILPLSGLWLLVGVGIYISIKNRPSDQEGPM